MEENKKDVNLADAMVDRNKVIVKTSIVGIIANLFLVAFKAAVGLVSNSIAVILDAVNNLSDALSSVITIVGTKLANKLPDKKHPLGYGRIEYLSAMIVSALVLYAGITSAVESVKKIIHPEQADYSKISLIIIAVAVLVKLVLGRYVKAKGRKVNSQSLVASGSDAAFDAILSLSVLVSALIYTIWGVSLEAYVGVIISIIIIKSGVEMMLETVNDILGKRAEPETVQKIKELIIEEPEVRGAYDIIINNYGPEKNYASVHLELPDVMTVDRVDELSRKIQAKVYVETGVILTGVGIYSYNTGSGIANEIRNAVLEQVLGYDWALQLHGFYLNEEEKTVRFDVVMSFDIKPEEGVAKLYADLKQMYPEYEFMIIPDVDLADVY
ncbi:MAG: cation transporter [Clostridia bacterium]|nr:cation transporter [Clostridia bacterium]